MSSPVQIDSATGEAVDALQIPVSNSPTDSSASFTPYSPPPAERKLSFPRWWVIVLIILAAPMIIALLSVPFSIMMAIASFVFALAVTGVALIGAGIASLISIPLVITANFGSAVFIGGMGLMNIGFGIIFLVVNIKLVKFLLKGLKFVWRKLFKRENKHAHGFDGGVEHGRQQ